jgi:hypothetical protein
MLKEQEAALSKSLDFVRKAIQLFESQGTGGITASIRRRRGRPRGRKAKLALVAAVASAPKAAKGAVKTRNRKGGKHIDRILSVLKEKKGPLSSADLITNLYKAQTKDKDIKHFSTLIYPVLTKAYKSKVLRLKGGKVHLG